jgi:hypothetical protein
MFVTAIPWLNPHPVWKVADMRLRRKKIGTKCLKKQPENIRDLKDNIILKQ